MRICTGVLFAQIFLAALVAGVLKWRDAEGELRVSKQKKEQSESSWAGLLFAMAFWIGSAMVMTLFNKWLFLQLPNGDN